MGFSFINCIFVGLDLIFLKEFFLGLICYNFKFFFSILNLIISKFILEEIFGFRKRRRIFLGSRMVCKCFIRDVCYAIVNFNFLIMSEGYKEFKRIL